MQCIKPVVPPGEEPSQDVDEEGGDQERQQEDLQISKVLSTSINLHIIISMAHGRVENAHQLVFSVPGRGEESKVDDKGGDQISQDWVGYQVAKHLRCDQYKKMKALYKEEWIE